MPVPRPALAGLSLPLLPACRWRCRRATAVTDANAGAAIAAGAAVALLLLLPPPPLAPPAASLQPATRAPAADDV
jgi:hypothetical protein